MSRLESEPGWFPARAEQPMTPMKSGFTSNPIERQTPMAYPLERKHQAFVEFEQSETPLGILLQNASVLMKSGEHLLASHILTDVLRRDSAHELAIRNLGECYFHLKDWQKAERILRISLDLSPFSSTKLLYAEVLYGLGRNDQALELYNELLLDLTDERELFTVYKSVGNIHVRQGDLDSAEECYNKAFTINPHSDVLLVNYGTLEIQRGQVQAALERYREALVLNDQNEKAWVGVALIHREYGDLELSWGNLHKALDLDPSNQTALQLMADWAVKDHRFHDVIGRLEHYLSINDQDAEKSLLLAKLFYITGRKDLARLEATRALSLNPLIEGGEEFFSLVKPQAIAEGDSSEC